MIDDRDAVIRVTVASICNSDLHIKHGLVPRAMPGVTVGHEFVGVVESVGPGVTHVSPGDRVAVCVETFCGECYFCRRGWVNNCTSPIGGWALGCRIDGCQTEYVRVPFADTNLIPIPDSVSDESALFTGDILATGYWSADISGIRKGDVVAILGAGPTGLCCAMCARLHGPSRIVVIEPLEERRRFALSHGLADVILDPFTDDLEESIGNETEGRGADVVIEAAGGPDTFQTAWKIARPNATVCIVAMYGEPQSLPLPDMYGKNLTFKTGGVDASECGRIMELIEAGELNPSILITHTFDFKDVITAYDLFESRKNGVLKIALQVSPEHSETEKGRM